MVTEEQELDKGLKEAAVEMEEEAKNQREPAKKMSKPVPGAFMASLKRNNRQIRDDRALAISEDTQMLYKRNIEDLEVSIKRKMRDQENMLDLSPTTTQSLILASDFDSSDYVAKDVELGVQIRNLEIKLGIALKRYDHLFGGI